MQLAVLSNQHATPLVGSVLNARLSLKVRHGPASSSVLVQVSSSSSTSLVSAETGMASSFPIVTLQVVVALPVTHLPMQVGVVSKERRSPTRVACSRVPAVLLDGVNVNVNVNVNYLLDGVGGSGEGGTGGKLSPGALPTSPAASPTSWIA